MSRPGIRHLLAGLAMLLLALPLAAMAASAQEGPEPELFIRAVDSRDRDAVLLDFVYTGDPGDVDGLTLLENGEQVTPDEIGDLPPASPRRGIVFVIDTSRPMDESGALVDAKAAVQAWIEEADPATEIALVAANADKASVLQNLTTSRSQLLAQLDELGPSDGSSGAIWSGVKIAGASLRSRPALQPNVVVIAGSVDEVSGDLQDAARGELMSVGAAAWVAGYTGNGMGMGRYESLTDEVGGLALGTDDGQQVGESVDTLAEAVGAAQFRLQFASTTAAEVAAEEEAAAAEAEESGEAPEEVDDRAAELDLQVGGLEAGATVVLGGNAVGKSNLNPTSIPGAVGIPFLQGTLGLILAVVVTLVACVLLAYGLTSLFVKDDALAAALQPYSDAYGTELTAGEEGDDTRPAILQRAVAITEQVAESQGYLSRAEAALERANMPLRAGEALFFYAMIVLGVTLLALLLFRSLFPALVLGVIGALIPPAVVNFKASRRRKAFMSQLPDTLQLLSGTLRAGYSLMQGVEAVSQEVEEPMGHELRRVVTESRLGRPLEESLDSAAERMNSPDFAWAVMAIRIQREVGGNLSELLLTVADTMVARERLRRDVASLTAEGRVSAMVLGFLPIGLGAAMFALNPDYISKLFTETLGIIMLIMAGVSMLIGFFWMKKIIDIEI